MLLQNDTDLVNQKRAMVLLKMALASQNLTTTSWAAFQLLHSVLDEFALPVIQVYGYLALPLCPVDGSYSCTQRLHITSACTLLVLW